MRAAAGAQMRHPGGPAALLVLLVMVMVMVVVAERHCHG